MIYSGMRIIEDANCLADTTVRNFPVSRHRSKRILKKLIKRYGGEFRREPAIFKIGDKLVAHPVMYEKIKRELQKKEEEAFKYGRL